MSSSLLSRAFQRSDAEASGLMSRRAAGILLIVASALAFSFAGIFTRGIDAGGWDIIFWRGVFSALLTVAWLAVRRQLTVNFIGIGIGGWSAAVVGASGTAAFIWAFLYTSVANVSVIYSLAPIIAGLTAWLWIGERLTPRLLLASGLSVVGVVIIVSRSLGAGALLGDLLALWMATAMALWMVIYRRWPQTPSAGPTVLQSVLLLLPCGLLGAPMSVAASELALMAAFGLVFSFAAICLAEGARRLPAGETALLSGLEIPLAAALAWIILAEAPSWATVIGGVLIVIAVIWLQWPQPAARPLTETTGRQ